MLTGTDKAPEVANVAFRVPPSWKSDVVWFLQVASGFINAGMVSETTKFQVTVSALDAEIISYVRDIVIEIPEDIYTVLKDRIVKQYTQSDSSRLRTLLQDMHLGDKRPSQLLYEMQGLSAVKVLDYLLRTLWLQRLLTQMQHILSISSASSFLRLS